jgi:hypothetical protein
MHDFNTKPTYIVIDALDGERDEMRVTEEKDQLLFNRQMNELFNIQNNLTPQEKPNGST